MPTTLREVLLQVMSEYAGQSGQFQSRSILGEVGKRMSLPRTADEQALLALWADMFRLGIVAPGYNLSNPDLPFCHLTALGRKTLQTLSRDPANPDGYLAAVRSSGNLNPIADSYIAEALSAYNAVCFKAAAVMVGAATESLVLELRDVVVERLQALQRPVARNLTDWRVKTVFDAINLELTAHTRAMPVRLREAFVHTWPAFLQQIRSGRNDAGHPTSIAPISVDGVHASLLIFPEALTLSADLRAWVNTSMP
jgi:hypothetical protein